MKAYKALDSRSDQTTLHIWNKYEKLMKDAIRADHYFALHKLMRCQTLVKGNLHTTRIDLSTIARRWYWLSVG